MKNWKKISLALLALISVLILAVGLYAGDYYRAEQPAVDALSSGAAVEVFRTENRVVFSPQEVKAGFVFYPGGKVEYTAYAPLMQLLAQEGILCVLVKMPLNLAVLDMDAAAQIPQDYPEAERWYIGGHSLGGSMAASFLADREDFQGLVMLAAYSTADLSEKDLRVLSLYGDQDQVLDMEKYDQYLENLPEDTVEMVFSGGNHAQFGSYGPQEGDGEAIISRETQTALAAQAIAGLILE